jgi:hypothetical protein
VRRIRYRVAMSLDGYIAGPHGEFDWIIGDPEMDFGALFQQFDTLLVGRGTFEFMVEHGQATVPEMKIIVFSRKLQQCDFPDVAVWPGRKKKPWPRCARSRARTYGYSAAGCCSAVFWIWGWWIRWKWR